MLDLFKKIYPLFLSEQTKKRIEKFILYVALIGFLVHLLLIFFSNYNIFGFQFDSELFKNPISAIYTPFSFILVYEVYLLIYYLPKSFTTYITKQYEIITLIIIRKLFKDLSNLELTSNWFEIKSDLQFTYDILASIILFYLIYQFQKQGMRKLTQQNSNRAKIERFINQKKVTALLLVPIFFLMAIITFSGWLTSISSTAEILPSFETVNNLFFDEFFTVLILVDVVLLLLSFFYTDKFHKIIRNSGFVVSTILIRLSFSVSGLVSTVLVVSAVLFGLAIIIIHNMYENNSSRDKSIISDN